MGGSGARYTRPPTSDAIQRKLERAEEQERARLNGEVDNLIQRLLARYNNRDTELVSERLGQVEETLGEVANVETLLFGGSVAKYTAVNGLSDVDALVILDRGQNAKESPEFLIEAFRRLLQIKLPRSEVAGVDKGRLAVTVRYKDGEEVQLLPALRSGQRVFIASSDGKSWQQTRPQTFQRTLTDANARMNHNLVPTIKLIKPMIADLPKQKQLTGYHLETLAVDAAQAYEGPKTPRHLLSHVLGHSEQRVLRPISDVTGQSRNVDEYLGAPNSVQRRNVSQALGALRRALGAANTLSQWHSLLGNPDSRA